MQRGGKRTGAGRKRTKFSRSETPLKRTTAEEVLSEIDEKAFWHDLLAATNVIAVSVIGGESGEKENITVPDRKIRLQAGIYLTNRRDGMPKQVNEIEDNRGILLNHAIPRPERNQSVQ